MKTVKHLGLAAAFLIIPFFSFAQEPTAESLAQNVRTTFFG